MMQFQHHVYYQRKFLNAFRSFIWHRKGELFVRLHGANHDFRPPSDLYIEPVYIPFLSWKKDGGHLYVDIRWLWNTRCRTLLFMSHPPFFWTGTSDQVKLEEMAEMDETGVTSDTDKWGK
jgi:hypothetical protein